MKSLTLLAVAVFASASAAALPGQDVQAVRAVRDSVTLEFVDADLRGVIQALARYLPKPVLIASVPSVRVSLSTPTPVARSSVMDLVRGLLDQQSLDLVEEAAYLRIRERPTQATPQPATQAPGAVQARRRAAVQLYVIRLRHTRAPDVAGTVNLLFGGGGQFSGSAGLSSGTLSEELRRIATPPAAQPAAPAAGGGTTIRPAELSGAVTIVPDDITNALLIRAAPEDFEVIRQAVDELDIRPLQVLIEVLIVEARRDQGFSLGTDLLVPQQHVGGGDVTAGGSVAGAGLGDFVLQVLNLGRANLNATIRAAENRGQVSIVSRPVLLASNNTEARLLVGSQRPFVQVSRSLPTETATRDQVVQYRDVGTRLVVRRCRSRSTATPDATRRPPDD